MAEGDVLIAPGFGTQSEAASDEIMYSMQGYTQKGVTLKSGQGVVYAGSLLKRDTDGTYIVAAAADTGIEGFLRQATNTSTDADMQPRKLGNIVLMGAVKVLPTATYAAAGAQVATALGGRYDATRKVIFF